MAHDDRWWDRDEDAWRHDGTDSPRISDDRVEEDLIEALMEYVSALELIANGWSDNWTEPEFYAKVAAQIMEEERG